MLKQVFNVSAIVASFVYGVISYAGIIVSVLGLFMSGWVGFVPGVILSFALAIAIVLAAIPAGWFAARGSLEVSRRANLGSARAAAILSGALAAGIPYVAAIFILVGIPSLMLVFSGDGIGNALASSPLPLYLLPGLVIGALGALGGALYPMLGSKLDNRRVYKNVVLGVLVISLLSVCAMGIAFFFAIQPKSDINASGQAARRAEYETTLAAQAARQALEDSKMSAQATAAAQARANASPQPLPRAWTRIAMSDAFAQNTNTWSEGNRNDYTGKTIRQEFLDGKYRWTIQTNKPGGERAISGFWDISVFQASVTGQRVHGADDCGYGIFLSPYGFVIRDTGEWFWVDEQSWGSFRPILQGKSDAIRAQQPNRIRVDGNGPNYILSVNDQWVGEVDADKSEKSNPGIMMDIPRAATCAIDFDDFELRTPN